jgi:hypothetical protein
VSIFAIDLNHDGIADFGIFTRVNSCTDACSATVAAYVGKGGIGIEGKTGADTTSPYVWALRTKARIGPCAKFIAGRFWNVMVAAASHSGHSRTVRGYWDNVKNRYLGFKFAIKGTTHYGWARLNVWDHGNRVTAVLTGYAYETIPNKPIIAGKTNGSDDISVEEPDAMGIRPIPKPSTLGVLAVGSPGLSIGRRKERVEGAW